MSELFKSAISNWVGSTVAAASDQTTATSQGSHSESNPFVGQTVDLDNKRIRIERVIAEGKCTRPYEANGLITQFLFTPCYLCCLMSPLPGSLDTGVC